MGNAAVKGGKAHLPHRFEPAGVYIRIPPSEFLTQISQGNPAEIKGFPSKTEQKGGIYFLFARLAFWVYNDKNMQKHSAFVDVCRAEKCQGGWPP
jgi:hypothetical protein